MRILWISCLTAGMHRMALAHELADSAGHVQQVAHHLLSLHHLPALILLALAVLVLFCRAAGRGRRTKREKMHA